MGGVGYLGAFLGGVLSLVSPCSALLLPSFFAYAFGSVGRLVLRTTVFFLGLSVSLAPLGAAAGTLGGLLNEHRSTVTLVSGLVLIAFGLMSVTGTGFHLGAAQRASSRLRISSNLSVFALGAVYGLAGFCAGPLLGSVLTVSAMGGNALYGTALLVVYAFGMAFPLFVLALLWERFGLSKRAWLRGREVRIGPLRTHTTSLIAGLLFIGIGVLFLVTEGTANLGGMSVDTQFAWQEWIERASRAVPDSAVLLAAVVVAACVLGWRVLRRRRAGLEAPARKESEAGTHAPARTGGSGTQAESD